jgi:hypothetical protein
MSNLESLKDRIKRMERLDNNVLLVERIDGVILLIRRNYPCPHRDLDGSRARHLHFHITSVSEIDSTEKLERRLSWLEAGFWSDSMIWDSSRGLENLIERFLTHKCPGALQNL